MANDSQDRSRAARADWVRHEISNPLNVIMGALRLLEMGGVTPQQQKQIDLCRGAITRITAVIDHLDGSGAGDLVTRAAAELRALGGVTFLRKPFDRSDLLRTVQIAARTHRNLRLLAADDVPEVGWLLEALLASSGSTLEMVSDGAAAIARAQSAAYDVILLDLEMPGTDGVQAARAIRADERTSHRDPVPIVIVSGHDLEGSPQNRASAASPGDDDVVYPDAEIAPLVPEFLQNRRADAGRIETLIEKQDWEELRALGHRMKGTGRGYGFARISEIGGAIEEAGLDEDESAARKAAADLARYLDRVRVAAPADSGDGNPDQV